MKAWILKIITQLIVSYLRKKILKLQVKIYKARYKLNKKLDEVPEIIDDIVRPGEE